MVPVRSVGSRRQPAARGAGERSTILWIDDEAAPDDPLVRLLDLEGVSVEIATSGELGLRKAAGRAYDLVLVDLRLPDLFGLTVLRRLRDVSVPPPAVVLTGQYLEAEIEADARRCGAKAVVHKPLLSPEVVLTFLGADVPQETATSSLVAASPQMRQVVQWVAVAARTASPVLLTGETGTGKDVTARRIHDLSLRRNEPFIAVNCAALPEALLESELFGHRRGAFTGADRDKVGLFQAANGGTIFLDEIGELALPLQPRLLRALENGKIRRVGDTLETSVDVRVIAATNRRLERDVEAGRFREDLYYRIAVLQQHLPPLRQRPDDVEALCHSWLSQFARNQGRTVPRLSDAAITLLRQQSWPGNARQLRNVLESAVSMASGDCVEAADLLPALGNGQLQPSSSTDDRIVSALRQNRWNRTLTAKQLGVSRTTLWRLLKDALPEA